LPSAASQNNAEAVRIERFDLNRHDVAAITALLNAAYAPYVAQGMKYVAATQDDAVTRERLARGIGFVAFDGETLVGTVAYYNAPSAPEAAAIEWYRRPGVGTFGQFAVAPGKQKGGVGIALLDAIEQLACDEAKTELACETAAKNAPLVAYYHRRGFRGVGLFKWPGDEHACVVLSKTLS
jgi:GNAT superfamily N-acetyltransferase